MWHVTMSCFKHFLESKPKKIVRVVLNFELHVLRGYIWELSVVHHFVVRNLQSYTTFLDLTGISICFDSEAKSCQLNT